MSNFNRKEHWEKIYTTKELKDVSWYQPVPHTSLDLIEKAGLSKDAKIIDIGGGDSFLADHLLKNGYTDITVLDISETALERAKKRLGDNASQIKWIVCDITSFMPAEKYDLWHDRAAFHFLTDEDAISQYIEVINKGIETQGILILGTFSENGPKKCSGIDIKQYSETSMTERLKDSFDKISCITVDHPTPFDTVQNFVFCTFRKK